MIPSREQVARAIAHELHGDLDIVDDRTGLIVDVIDVDESTYHGGYTFTLGGMTESAEGVEITVIVSAVDAL